LFDGKSAYNISSTVYELKDRVLENREQTSIFFDLAFIKPYNLYMPRIARIVAAEGYPHHITQKGNYQKRYL
jgi:hypothetical protein